MTTITTPNSNAAGPAEEADAAGPAYSAKNDSPRWGTAAAARFGLKPTTTDQYGGVEGLNGQRATVTCRSPALMEFGRSQSLSSIIILIKKKVKLIKKGPTMEDPKREADGLFQKHAVLELRAMVSKMKGDIETKKHDLRIMVGERYRDLLEAADSVRTMKEAATAMQSTLSDMRDCCDVRALKRQIQSDVLQGKDVKTGSEQSRKQLLYPIAAMIKLLADTPEEVGFAIWRALEVQQFLRASRLWQFSNTVYRTLQGTRESGDFVLQKSFPVFVRLWDAASHFRSKIKEQCLTSMKSPNLSDEELAEIIASLMVLERTNLRQALSTFLEQRKLHILAQLDVDIGEGQAEPLSKKMNQFVQAFVRTVAQAHSLFYRPVSGAKDTVLSSQLSALSVAKEPNALLPSIAFMFSEKTNVHLIFRQLPPQVQTYAPFINYSDTGEWLPSSTLKSLVSAWANSLKADSELRLYRLLETLRFGRQLSKLRSSLVDHLCALEVDKEAGLASLGWKEVKNKLQESTNIFPQLRGLLLHEEFSLWEELFRAVFARRVNELIVKSMEQLELQPIKVVVSKLGSNEFRSTEHSFSDFIWSAASNSTGPTIFGRPSPSQRMQSPALQAVVSAFEKSIRYIAEDVSPLLGGGSSREEPGESIPGFVSKPSPSRLDASDFNEDYSKFLRKYQDESRLAVLKLRDGLLALLKDRIAAVEEDHSAIDECLFIGKCCRSIASNLMQPLIHDLESELTPTHALPSRLRTRQLRRRAAVPDVQSDKGLTELREALMDVYRTAYSVWISATADKFSSDLESGFLAEDWAKGSRFLGIWEAIPIRAETESGDVAEEQLRLPVHTSPFLISVLLDVSREINRAGGYSIEKEVLQSLTDALTDKFLHFYEDSLSKLRVADWTEKSFIQIMFDVGFMGFVFKASTVSLTDDGNAAAAAARKRAAKFQNLNSILLSYIDPIDWAVAGPHVTGNVDRFYYRTSALLGLLEALNPKPSDLRKNPTLNELHNVIPVVGQSPRFTLLPVSQPLARPSGRSAPTVASQDPKFIRQPTLGQSTKRPPIRISFASSAARGAALGHPAPIAASSSQPTGSVATGPATVPAPVAPSIVSGVGGLGTMMVGLVGAATSAAQNAASGAAQSSQWNLGGQRTLIGGASAMFAAWTSSAQSTTTPAANQPGVSFGPGVSSQPPTSSPSTRRS
ncbi:hypothetical protein DFJ73DRAFT_762613 [Zopfochytrium polystomum]|nr:hypothetical protein DFJ73DRAFT_762613 [Zopfochytrium polystomum]